MMARRLLYFPMLVNEIKRHFGSITRTEIKQKDFLGLSAVESSASFSESSASFHSSKSSQQNISITTTEQNWWFTFKFNEKDCLIPLHLPIGLIYDLLMSSGTVTIPWKLEFHISHDLTGPIQQNLISQVLNYSPLPDESALTCFYFSALKESDHLRSGSAKNVMNLSRAEQLQLWEALKSGECEKFWRINQKLISISSTKSVPIKFWIFESSKSKFSRFQFPIQQDLSVSLKQVLLTELSDSFMDKIENVCLHGISIHLNIKLEELNHNWNYSDNFINIIIKLRE